MSIPRTWGVRPHELDFPYPCDELVSKPADVWFRAVTVHATAPTVYRWLCQLKVAPYSYDMLDNFGRRSPRTLTPGADVLTVGEQVMTIFRLASFEYTDHLTLEMSSPRALAVFGELALSYIVREIAPHQVRLVTKLLVTTPPGALGGYRRRALAWGDLLMMRRQLRTLARLAENTGEPK